MRISSITKNAGKACNNRLYRHIRTFEKIVKNYFVISIKYMETIVGMLNKGGFLNSLRGHSGGYKLSRPASNIVVGDVLRFIEGSLAPIPCLETEENTCELASMCQTLPFWKGLYTVVTNYVDKFTIEDLIEMNDTNKGDFYCI